MKVRSLWGFSLKLKKKMFAVAYGFIQLGMRDFIDVQNQMEGTQAVSTAQYFFSASVKLSCGLDVKKFPFDTQKYPIVFKPTTQVGIHD